MDPAEIRLIQKVFIKERGVELTIVQQNPVIKLLEGGKCWVFRWRSWPAYKIWCRIEPEIAGYDNGTKWDFFTMYRLFLK